MRIPTHEFSLPRGWEVVLGTGAVLFLLNHLWCLASFYRAHRSRETGLLPPKYPTLMPMPAVFLRFILDPRNTMRRLVSFEGQASVARLSIFSLLDIYLYQDPTLIRHIFKQAALLDVRPLAVHALVNCFGMSRLSAARYLDDDSGHYAEPAPGSSIPAEKRVFRILHQNNRRALVGPGLESSFRCFRHTLADRLRGIVSVDGEWVQVPDLTSFMQNTVGASLIEAVFGRELLDKNPDFLPLLFDFDEASPSLLKGMTYSRALRTRHALLHTFKIWARQAAKKFKESSLDSEGERDPFWGSTWTRHRHEALRQFFDEEARASMDLGAAWGTTTHTVPCTMMALVHLLQDKPLLDRLLRSMDRAFGHRAIADVDAKSLTTHPLLSAIYAETLRLHVTVFIPVVPLHGDLSLGKWKIPRGSYGAISAGVSHHNEDVWNTREGEHPVDSFWADRFIVDPRDHASGPVRPERLSPTERKKRTSAEAPYFSTEGLEGTWLPYGGGSTICPGRLLSKNVIVFACALLTSEYDMELLTDSVTLGQGRFGMGVEYPTRKVPFKIRKRERGEI